MSLRLILAVSLLGLVIPSSCLAQLSSASPQAASTSAAVYPVVYPIDGIVVNSVTGAPVNAALVQANFPGARISVLTQPDGEFHLADVPQGLLNISVQKPGFFSEQQSPRDSMMANQFVAGPDTPLLVLKLVPEGIIYGRIADSDGVPIERLPVALLYASISDGRKNWLQRFGAQTSEDGEFRIFGIPPGSYYLRAGQNTDRASRAQGSFAVAYYPGRPDRDSAAMIVIAPGAQIRADFNVAPTRFYQISGTVVGYPLGSRVNVQLFGSEIGGANAIVTVNQATGAFRLPSVAAGAYVLRALAATGDQQRATSLPVSVNADISGLHMPIRFHFERKATGWSRTGAW
jgi:hypothetical protein